MSRIAFRVDASSQIGTGHLMRCLTLADELRRRGWGTFFISRWLPEYFQTTLAEKGHEVRKLSSENLNPAICQTGYEAWLGTTQEEDAVEVIHALSDGSWDWVVVDHYALDVRWEERVRRVAKRVLAIDDLANRRHACDVVLDQNLYLDAQNRYLDLVHSECRLLLGPKYALLREEFRQLRRQVRLRRGPIRRILVFMGGVDAANCTRLAIDALAGLDVGLEVDVVIGSGHPAKSEIEKTCDKCGFVCHIQTSQMAELMLIADLAIGAAGSASWERCCLGLPAILISLAENQINIAVGIDKIHAGLYLGNQENITVKQIQDGVANIRKDGIFAFSRNAYELVDGEGTFKVANILESYA